MLHSDPNQNARISIQNCGQAYGSLTGVQTYLGRLIIDTKGWLPWADTAAPDTIFYLEYQNNGPGSVTKSRVKWRGLKLNINSKLANLLTVNKFLHGNQWLPPTGVTFRSDLSEIF
ncbi:esterase [Lithospermum erythrorhizon]|uniref:Esterase n=1 Tax=Lithospermum erythrorhizon TaxID=34254 RepID=A0AAV3P424_LITER